MVSKKLTDIADQTRMEKAEELRKLILRYFTPNHSPATGKIVSWRMKTSNYHKIKHYLEDLEALVPEDYVIYEDDDGPCTLKYISDHFKKTHDNKRKPGWDI